MGNLLTLNYWFNLRPDALASLPFKIILGLIILLAILSVITAIIKKRWTKSLYAPFWNNSYYFFLTNAIIGLTLAFFSYELVPFLSARFWFLLWGLSMVVWLFFIIKIVVKIPQQKAKLEKEKEFKKYIP